MTCVRCEELRRIRAKKMIELKEALAKKKLDELRKEKKIKDDKMSNVITSKKERLR